MVSKIYRRFGASGRRLRPVVLCSAIAAFYIGASSAAQASSVGGVTITTVLTTNGNTVYFTHSGTRTGVPSCGTTYTNRFAFNAGTPAGQALLSTLLTAYSMQKNVSIVGTGACTTTTDTEDVSYILVGP
jgi:hypothetical protein